MNKKIMIIGAAAFASVFLAAGVISSKLNGGGPPTPLVDTAAPVITNLRVKKITATTADVVWFTSQPTTDKVYYSTTTPVAFDTALVATGSNKEDCDEAKHKKFRQTVNVANLAPETTYYFIVESTDMASNSSSSTEMSFKTKKSKDDKGKDIETATDLEDAKLKCKPIKVK